MLGRSLLSTARSGLRRTLQEPARRGIADVSTIQTVTGLLGPAISIGLYASPAKIAQEIFAAKSTMQYSALPYVTMFANCSLWTNYGYLIGNASICAPNLVGMGLSAGTLAVYLQNTNQTGTVMQQMAGAGAGLGAILGYVYLVAPTDVAASHMGLIASVICICMFASPLATVADVLKEKNSRSLPLPVIVMGTANCGVWATYGFCLGDIYVYGPNTLGFLLSFFQLMLCMVYPAK
eukprot:NODE_1434_length_953_cov_113.935841_g1110_i0.p1 GENE.NODE_1434_length_953_cov_113.935841_g1110_i0~~NODE_1434_length_953_cov_113.935841_g1110_i0.p1  ORF type:complete len:236 (+),score=40.26 NODE_1434_length_953_cov_113.935841_g1110_i0:59-766(+)